MRPLALTLALVLCGCCEHRFVAPLDHEGARREHLARRAARGWRLLGPRTLGPHAGRDGSVLLASRGDVFFAARETTWEVDYERIVTYEAQGARRPVAVVVLEWPDRTPGPAEERVQSSFLRSWGVLQWVVARWPRAAGDPPPSAVLFLRDGRELGRYPL